ncbi:hypothetical protein ABT390_19495 [Streptomyces aurantiacus]|uniref:Uncharacterized protein n=1 Tax=Streptomyces aurantiacus JA 4570 TaxID=1286094 RepID=S3ZAA9_9ACTN|nr:hypothetical protein [Streptomyces aurantiacus]EPH40033.1 hypothetical protein STRAU_6917 [Streptomyces aurantiacus JA 4570]
MLSGDLARGFWCECWAEDLTAPGRPTVTTSFGAYSATQADGWLPTALRAITAELNPAAPETWAWLYEVRIDTRRALLRSEPCTASVTYASTRITWTVHPVLFLPLGDRDDAPELPPCTHDFKPHEPD